MDVRAAAAAQIAPLFAATFAGSADEQLRTGLCPQLSDALLSLEANAGLAWRIQESVIQACAGYATPVACPFRALCGAIPNHECVIKPCKAGVIMLRQLQ